jgi:hypothetical protein
VAAGSPTDETHLDLPAAALWLRRGGGMKRGFVFGRTDQEGREIEEGEVKIPDFNATLAQGLGLPLEQKVMSPSNRPFTVADKGRPITALFA